MQNEINPETPGFDENAPAPNPAPAPAPEQAPAQPESEQAPQRSPFDLMGQAMDATRAVQGMVEGQQAVDRASGTEAVRNVQQKFEDAKPPSYQSKFDFINKKTHEEPLVVPPPYADQLLTPEERQAQKEQEAEDNPTRENNPDLFKNKDGLDFGNQDEYKQLARQRYEERHGYSGYLIGKNPEIFANDPNITKETWNPDYVFEKLGATQEEQDFEEKEWYARRGYAMPDERYEKRDILDHTENEWDKMSPEEREAHNEWRASKGLEPAKREDFGRKVGDEFVHRIATLEDIAPANPGRAEAQRAHRAQENEEALELFNKRLDYAREVGGYDKGDPRARELAAQASSMEHLDILIDIEDQKFSQRYADQKYVAPQGDVADDMGQYASGFWDKWGRGMADAARATPGAFASAGASVYALGGRALGIDPEMFDNYTASIADHAMHTATRNAMLDETLMRVSRVTDTGIEGFDRFMTDTAYKGAEIGGMLTFDIATSFLTGKIPGATTLLSTVGGGTIRLGQRGYVTIGRSFTEGALRQTGSSATSNFGKEAAKQFTRVSKLPPPKPTTYRAMMRESRGGVGLADALKNTTVRGLAHDGAGMMRRVAAREITHGPNTFLTRVYGESYAASITRQADRAASEGREVSMLDQFFAMGDATASATIAHLIGKNIPQFRNRLPSKGKGSGGLFSILGNKGFTPKTLEAATTRARARALLAPVRSGADFASFDLLMDAYSLTDQDDRMDVLDRYVNHTGEQFKNLFSSFLIGMPMGVGKMPTQYRSEFRKFREYKNGAEGLTYLNSLPPKAKTEIMDSMSNAYFEGMKDRVNAEKDYVNGSRNYLGSKPPLAEYSRETLAELLLHGDRELPAHLTSTMDGVPGLMNARYTERAHTANEKGGTREHLVGADGKIEITRNMARLELQRRGESIDAAQMMNGKVDTLFMGKTEATARRKVVAAEMNKRFTPSSPKPGQVTGVRGMVESIATFANHPLIMSSAQVFSALKYPQRMRVIKTASEMAYADALVSSNASVAARVRRLAVMAQKDTNRFNDPALRPYLQKALKQTGMHRVIRQRKNLDPLMDKASTVVDNVIRSNERLSKWVISESNAGRNTPAKPAISRRQMERLAGGKISKQENTKQARYELGRMITAAARDKLSPINENVQGVRMKSSRGELAPPTKPPIPIEQANTPVAMGKAVSKPQVMTPEAFKKRTEEAKARGSQPLPITPLPRSEKPASMERERPIDTVISRLEAEVQIEQPLREPVPVRAKDGNPVFGIPIKDRMRLSLKRLRDEFGIDSVELDFGEGFHSLLGNSIHAIGRANGFSVVVAHGKKGSGLPEVMDMGNGIIVFNNSVQPQVARGQLASRGATLKWFAEREETNPLNWLEHHIAGGVGLKRMMEVHKARTGRETTMQEFKDGLLLASENAAESTAVWEMLFPVLSAGERQEIISRYPREMAQWYQHQMAQIQGAGFAPNRKNATVLGGAKESSMIMGVADGSVEYAGARGNTKSSVVNGIEKAVQRRKELFSTPNDIVTEYRANREALAGELRETTKPPVETDGSLESRRAEIEAIVNRAEPVTWKEREARLRIKPAEFIKQSAEKGLDVVYASKMNGRDVVVVRADGRMIPFYLSTGDAGKATVAAGNWYNFLGVGYEWFNKGSQNDINRFYGDKVAIGVAEQLNAVTGDKRPVFSQPQKERQGKSNDKGRAEIDAFNKMIGLERVVHEQTGDPLARGLILGENLRIIANAEKSEKPVEPTGVEPARLPEKTEQPFDRAEAEARVAEHASKPEVVDLFPDGKFDVPAAREIERKFPGFFQRAQRELKMRSVRGSEVQFEYHGYMFTVSPKKLGKDRVQVGKLTSEFVQWEGRAELLMSPEGKEVAEKNVELNASAPNRERATERELTSDREAGGGEPPAPPRPEPAQSGSPEPGKPGEVNFGISEGPQEPSGLKARVVRGLQYVMDPANYAILVGFEPFKKLIFDSYESVEVMEAQKAAKIEQVGRMFNDLRKDKSSELVNGKDSSALIRILEGAEIAPDMASLNAHPLTAKLSAKEKGYVIAIKEILESQRQDQMSMMRETVRVGYTSAGRAELLAKRANEYDKDLKVEVKSVGRKKMFEVNDGTSRVQFDREGFIDFMVQKQVPENYGYKNSYFPHMFFGRYRATITATDKNGKPISVDKLGLPERGEISGERQQIMESAQAKMKEIRERLGEEVSFDVQIRDGKTNIPKEAMYMPLEMRRRLVQTLKSETGASSNEINLALRGKLSSKPVKTAFLSSMLKREGAEGYSMDAQRVLELSINSHYRNLLSRRLQKEAQPQLEALAKMGAPEYIQQYARNNLEHIMYGTKREQSSAENRLDAHIAKGTQLMRSVQFYRQLMRPAQHVINSTQVSQVAALIGFKEFAGAVKDYNSAEGKRFIEEHGFFDLNGRFDAGKFGDSLSPTGAGFLHKVHGTVNKATGKFWNANSEARNQNFAFYAMARHAMKNLNMSPQEAAVYGRLYGSLMTQYRYSRANDPVFLRGDVMRTLGQFKRFQIQTFGLMATLSKQAATGEAIPGLGQGGPLLRFALINTVLGGARGSLLGAGFFLTGAMGLGAYRSIQQMVEGDDYIGGLPTNPFKSEAAAYQWLRDNMNEGAAELIMFGAMSGVGVDASGSFNLTNFGPGGFMDYIAGPTLGMVKRTYGDLQLRDAQARGMPVRMLESLVNSGQATRSLKSLVELATFWGSFSQQDGGAYKNTPAGILSANEYRAGTSEMVRYRTLMDQFAAVAGFRSPNGTSEYLVEANMDAWKQHWNDARNRVAAIYNRDPQAGREAMRKWNEAYGSMMYLGYGDIRSMRTTTEDRMTRSRSERNEDRRADEVGRGVDKLTRQRGSQ